MATRYNAFGWYNPYAPVSGGGVSTDGGEQLLKGLVVPVTAGPTWRVESDLNQGFVEVKNDGRLYATSPMAATTPVAATTTTTTTTTNGASNISTTDTSVLLLASAEKSKFRSVGIAFCILSSFTLGIVVSYLAVNIDNENCIQNKKTMAGLNEFYYWAPRVAPLPLPIFTFVIGILCIVIRERSGGQARTIYAMSIFCFVLLLPLLLAGGIGGIVEAQDCDKAAIEVIYLVLPAILLLMFLIFFALLVYLVLLLIAVKPATTSTTPLSTTTSVTVTTPVIPTVQPTPPPVQPPVQQPPVQPPNQPVIIQVAGPPAYRPLPSYQVIAPRYPAPRPPPVFGMAQYGRLPMRSPYGNYGYSPFRAPQMYRPYSYY